MHTGVAVEIIDGTPIGTVVVRSSPVGVSHVEFAVDRTEIQDTGMDAHASARRNAEAAAGEIREYFAGKLRRFETKIDWSGCSGWKRQVLQALESSVRFGETISYGELAARAGRPGGARAVGGIMAANPIPIIIGCHRVVAADGGIGGFAGSGGGLVELKRRLLELEGSAPPTLFDW